MLPLRIQLTGNVACAINTSDPIKSNSTIENLKNEHSIFDISNCAFVGF